MDEIKNFVDFLVGEFQKNITATTQNIVVHAATRDTLQRICDQLPNYCTLYAKNKSAPVDASLEEVESSGSADGTN